MLLLTLLAIFGASSAAPGYYYYGPPAYQKVFWYNQEPLQRQMTFQYQPQWMHHLSSSSNGGVTAFVAGNSGSTGSVLESSSASLDEVSTANAEESFATAESDDVELSPVATEVTKVATEPTKAATEATSQAPRPQAKKKFQKLPESDEEDEFDRRGQNPSSSGSGSMYFPLRFGSTNGAAIAIANSYSPGRGGSAVSHATAYGSPIDEKKPRQIP
ncbi:uncharacterized protein LOC129793586 [Lutzomyia longipalpis]|uniref:uncharacterized protein LOC129793586 n=1 Tax=Lutzomyia longipalpis TaxID=7200 RepID=UPI002483666D|nr:uncharacterized protein LOC129793586 [Lutzomyia longipalpis]